MQCLNEIISLRCAAIGQRSSVKSEVGFSLLEMLATLGILSVLLALAILNIKDLDNPVENASAQIQSFLKQARSQALSSTSAYFVTPASTTKIITKKGINCSDAAPVLDDMLTLELPGSSYLQDTEWSVCFTSRGLSDSNITFSVRDNSGASKTIEVVLGGAVREL